MSLSPCQTKIFDKYNIDPADRKALETAVQGVLDSYGYSIEQASVTPDGRKLLKMAVDEALVEAKKDQKGLLKAIRDQHPDLFGKGSNKVASPVEAAQTQAAQINEKITSNKDKVYSRIAEKAVKLKHYPLQAQVEDLVSLGGTVAALRDHVLASGAEVADSDLTKINAALAAADKLSNTSFDEVKGNFGTQTSFFGGTQVQIDATLAKVDKIRKDLMKGISDLTAAMEAVPASAAKAARRQTAATQATLMAEQRVKDAAAEEKAVQAEEAAAEVQAAQDQAEAGAEQVAAPKGSNLAEETPIKVEPTPEETPPAESAPEQPKAEVKVETPKERAKRIAAERAAARGQTAGEVRTVAPTEVAPETRAAAQEAQAKATPAKKMTPAEELAQRNGVDITQIQGTGANGAVTVPDVVNAMNTAKKQKADAAAEAQKEAAQAQKEAPPAEEKKPKKAKKEKESPWASDAARVYAESFSTPVTAEEIGKGTGKGGKITKGDVVVAIDRRRWREDSAAFVEAMKGKENPETVPTAEEREAKRATLPVNNDINQKALDKMAELDAVDLAIETMQDIRLYRGLASNAIALEFDNVPDGAVPTEVVLDILEESLHEQDPYRLLISQLRQLGLNDMLFNSVTNTEMVDRMGGDKTAAGLYIQGRDTAGNPAREIWLNELVLGHETLPHTILHELVHAATLVQMTTDNTLAQQLDGIRKAVIDYLTRAGDTEALKSYGLTDVDEFVAEAMTSPKFQRLLASIPATSSPKTLWGKFVDAIARSLGLNNINNTVLAHVVTAIPNLFIHKTAGDIKIRRDYEGTGPLNFIADAEKFDPTEAELQEMMKGQQMYTRPNAARSAVENARIGGTVRAMALPSAAHAATVAHNAFTGRGLGGIETIRKLGRAALGLFTMDQIVRTYSKMFDRNGKNPLRAYYDAMREKVTIARDEQMKAENINRVWREFAKAHPKIAAVLNNLMHDSTMAEMHPDKAYNDPAHAHLPQPNTPGYNDAKARHDAMVQAWNQLGQDGQHVYTQVRDFYQTQRGAIRRAALTRIADRNKIAGVLSPQLYQMIVNATDPATIEAIDFSAYGSDADELKANLKNITELTSVKGPYFPLRRFGQYVIEGVRDTKRVSGPFDKRADAWAEARKVRAQDIVAKVRTVKDPATGKFYVEKANRTVEMFEDIAEAQKRAEEMIQQGWKHKDGGNIRVTYKQDWHVPRGTGAHVLLAQAKKGMDDNSAAAKALDRAFIELLVEHSVRKSELSRRRVQGASRDMRRAFAERAYAGSWMVADFMTATAQHDAMRDISTMARNGSVRMGEVRNELMLRDQKSLEERQISGAEQAIGKLGFFWYLASPSYTAVNLTQVPLVALPYLSAKFGLGRSTAALWDGYRAIAGAAAKEAARLRGGLTGEAPEGVLAELKKQLSPGEQKMIDHLTRNGIVDSTFAQELVLTSKGRDSGAVDFVMNAARTMPQIAELVNRVVVAKAAYNLAKARGLNEAQATEHASEAVLETQFDYSDMNKPRYFKAFPGARAIMMFKMYAQGMYAMTVGNMLRSMNQNNTPAERKQARKMLAGVIVTHSLTAGILGGLFMEPLRALIGLAQFAFGDDDEPWDLDNEITQYIADMTDAQIAELVTRGLPRALGIDLAGRVGLNHMAFMGGPEARSYEEAYKNTLVAAAGPIGAIGANAMRGLDYLSKNEYRRGLEALTPKFARDLIRATRQGDEGMLDYNGNRIAGPEKFGPGEFIAQALGFQPQVTARTYEARTAQKETETALRDRRKMLMQMWRRADDKMEFYRTEIQPYNHSNPEFRIKYGDLVKSRVEQMRRERDTKAGVHTEKRSIRKIGEAYGV